MMNEMMDKINDQDKVKAIDIMMKEMMLKMMAQMDIAKMYPKCTKIMTTKLPKEKRLEIIPKIVKSLIENGSVGMSQEEKREIIKKITEMIN